MNTKYFAALIVGIALLTGCSAANEPTVCTTAAQSDWLDKNEFQESLLADGYQINEFKVTEGNCYEIYGKDAGGSKVEIYFNPIDGAVVKKEVH